MDDDELLPGPEEIGVGSVMGQYAGGLEVSAPSQK